MAQTFQVAALGLNVRICRDPRFGLSQMSWRASVAHHLARDTPSNGTVAWLYLVCDGLADLSAGYRLAWPGGRAARG